jgi:hypothetical protein
MESFEGLETGVNRDYGTLNAGGYKTQEATWAVKPFL